MPARTPHGWSVSPVEARAIQDELRGKVITRNTFERVQTIAGVDISVRDDTGTAAIVLLRYPDLETVEVVLAARPIEFPYIPGFLSFREIPVILDAFEKLRSTPDLFIVDGQGIAHPRGLGIASHLGVLIDLPTIGCAKSRLCGRNEEPGEGPGSFTWMDDRGRTIGAAVRTKRRSNPLYISPGHRIDLPTSIHYVLECCKGYRLPEPTRRAHLAAGRIPQTIKPAAAHGLFLFEPE